jgi:hypothetical protein
MRGLIFSLLAGLVGQSLLAADAEVVGYRSFGRKCKSEDVQVIANGNAFAVLFNRFGIDMGENDRTEGKARTEVCEVWVDFKIPTNQCLDRLEQVFSGGIIKSKNSSGFLNIAYVVPGIAGHKLTTWRQGDEIQPEDSDSLFTLELSKSANRHSCVRGKVRYIVVMVYSAVRRTYTPDFFVSNLDSVDGQLELRLKTR